MAYVVTAPYVTMKVKDDKGQDVIVGLYRDAPVPDGVDRDSLKKHLDSGMVAKVPGRRRRPAPTDADADASTDTAADDEVVDDEVVEEPPPVRSASKAEWVAFAVSQGVQEDEAEAATHDELVARFAD